jgi:glycosyltransferase involved in cell wall biosynthesis
MLFSVYGTLLTILAVLALFCNLYALIVIVLGVRQLRTLGDIEPHTSASQLMVSVIVPACNEQDTIEPALRSILTLDYDNIEIIVVNDRSTDTTGEVLQNIQKEYPELQILTISELPEGWLGKNNALHQGALKAKGEYLLFTDADILFAQSTLSRAVSLVQREKLDHLSLIFKNIAQGALLNAMMVDAGGGLFFLFKPWKVSDRESKHFMGVGAFNLIRKTVYREIGGHGPVRMHPIDDIMLGKVIKQSGFKQECLTAYDFLKVYWYDSTLNMIRGLMKNIFALYDFRIAYAMIAVFMIFVMTILPLWAVFLTTGTIRIICVLCVCVRLLSAAYGARVTGITYKTLPLSLVTPYINIYIIVTGMVKTLAGKGIEWRGTHYPLDKLKESMSIF